MTNEPPRQDGELQFDRVATDGAAATDQTAVTCAVCQRALTDEYYSVNGAPVCAQCKDAAASGAAAALKKRRFPKAALLGLLAAIAGAILYYGVIAITDFEIGIVAIACGYMVGWAVRKGAGGFGGRRYQILAAALTYFSVGLAYTPLAVKGALEGDKERAAALVAADSARPADSAAVADSVRAAVLADSLLTDSLLAGATDTTSPAGVAAVIALPRDSVSEKGAVKISAFLALGAVLLLVWALPLMAIFGSMPSGLISALIIGIGMRQAWVMAAPVHLDIQGPFKVGSGAAPAPA